MGLLSEIDFAIGLKKLAALCRGAATCGLLELEVGAGALGFEAFGFAFGEEEALGFHFATLQNILADGFGAFGGEGLKVVVAHRDAVQ